MTLEIHEMKIIPNENILSYIIILYVIKILNIIYSHTRLNNSTTFCGISKIPVF